MNSFNLAVCIAPSCLWNSSPQSQEEDAKKVSEHAFYQYYKNENCFININITCTQVCELVHFLIDNCCALFGDVIITLLKDFNEDKRSNYGSG